MAKTATFLRKLDNFKGNAQLYVLSEPVGWDYDWDTKQYAEETNHVIVSAVVALYSGAETYIFPADKEGNILDWGELDGSFRGSLNHEAALRNAGYEVVTKETG